jgi:hypothetical protein
MIYDQPAKQSSPGFINFSAQSPQPVGGNSWENLQPEVIIDQY